MDDEMMKKPMMKKPMRDSTVDYSKEEYREALIDTLEQGPEDVDELANILDQEMHSAMDAHQYVRCEQARGLDYYKVQIGGDVPIETEVDDTATSSQAYSKDIAENVDWLLPDLARVILSGENIVEFDTDEEEAVEQTKKATALVNYYRFKQLDFDREIHDFIKDGLLAKVGVLECYVYDPMPINETYNGINLIALQKFMEDSDVYIVEDRASQVSPSIDFPDGFSHDVEVQRRPPREFRIRCIKPEDFVISKDSKIVSQSADNGPRYTAHTENIMVFEAMTRYPDLKNEILVAVQKLGHSSELSSGGDDTDKYEIQEAREHDVGQNIEENVEYNTAQNPFTRYITVYNEYYRVDWNMDGVSELRHIIRIDKDILLNEEVEDNPFVSWTPYPTQHLFYGESQADKLFDIQDLNTSFLRIINDTLHAGLRPRIAVDEDSIQGSGTNTFADIINWSVGSPIRTIGEPGKAISVIRSEGDINSAVAMLQVLEDKKTSYSGVSKQQQGLDPDSVNRSGSALDKWQASATGRKELMARHLGNAIEIYGRKMLRLIIKHQDVSVSIKVGKDFQTLDPRHWSPNLTPHVYISGAVGSRDREIQNLMGLLNVAQGAAATYGPNNPIFKIDAVYNIIKELVTAMGFKESKELLSKLDDEEIGQYMQQQATQTDPAIEVAEINADLKKSVTDGQHYIDKYRLDQGASIDLAKINSDSRIKRIEIAAKIEIERIKAGVEKERIRAMEEQQDINDETKTA